MNTAFVTNTELNGSIPNADNLSRVVKIAVDNGEVESIESAYELFKTYCMGVRVGEEIRHSAVHQAALLTIVNVARRAFLGGVHVQGRLDVPLLVPFPPCSDLAEAVRGLQGYVVGELPKTLPLLLLGSCAVGDDHTAISLKVVFDNWQGGVIPSSDCWPSAPGGTIIPAAVLAAAFAVSEVFQHLRGNPMAGRRSVGASLWEPQNPDWQSASPGPTQIVLPSKLWLIGLGHLGQAYLWLLGLLPYEYPHQVSLVLHDFDRLAESNDSTSLLTNGSLIGQLKTRAMATWAEARGFQTKIIERPFPGGILVSGDEPRLALGGVDNPQARAAYEDAGFRWIVEAGLGSGPTEYLALRLHTFPASASARAKWGDEMTSSSNRGIQFPAYQRLSNQGMDECGLVRIASRSVGAPFVGAVAASFVVSEVLRFLNGGEQLEVLDMTLSSPAMRSTVPFTSKLTGFNPGFTT